MGYQCDFCGEQRAMVYCRSDAACLCLSCDRNVHSANALSKRHSRTLLCERCNSQPAFVRCSEERVSLCQNCDWIGHGNSTPALTHKRQTINCYSGCPSAAELSSIWSFVLDFPTVSESACEQEMGLMSIADMSKNETCGETDLKSGSAAGTSSMAGLNNSLVQNLEEPPGSANNASVPKFYCPGTKSPAFCENDDLYDDFNMDEMDLSLENYDELFGMTLTHAEELFENGGIDSLFKAKDMFAANSNRQGAAAAEGSSIGLLNAIQPECSNAASADSMMSAKTEPILCIAGRQANPSLSFSNATGDSTAGDYQECDTSILLTGEPPWCPPSTEASVTSASRSKAVMRYKEKKKTRKFDKTVRYASRKARADVRKRVKGRFVKAGDVYDYDPLSPTRSY